MRFTSKIIIAGIICFNIFVLGLLLEIYAISIGVSTLAVIGVIVGIQLGKFRRKNLYIVKEPQDLLKKSDGGRIETADEWYQRREKLKELVQDLEYGHIPDNPEQISVSLLSSQKIESLGTTYHLILSILPRKEEPKKFIHFSVWCSIPEGKGPFPAVVKVSPDGEGTQEPISEYIMERGYIFACYNHKQLDFDTHGSNPKGMAQRAYPDYDWGSLGVWAWGAMRVVDFLVSEPWVENHVIKLPVDSEKIIVCGHSRRGKTALLAGALDERFALVAPNCSGCGGAGSFLILGPGAQDIGSIASPKRLGSWFGPNFPYFMNNEKELPFDQHFMRALVAPRIMLSNDAFGDLWANPIGAQVMYEEAQPVFDLLGVPKNNCIHFREGGHAFNKPDFKVILDLADKLLLEKDIEGDFYMKPFSNPLK